MHDLATLKKLNADAERQQKRNRNAVIAKYYSGLKKAVLDACKKPQR